MAGKTYVLRITIEEGSNEFWESLEDKTGCDDVLAAVRDVLADGGFEEQFGTTVELVEFKAAQGGA